MHEGAELVFGNSFVSRSFAAVEKNSFLRWPWGVIILFKIKVFTLRVISFDGAKIEIICFGNFFNILVAVDFIGINRSLFWRDVFKAFRVNHVGVIDSYFID